MRQLSLSQWPLIYAQVYLLLSTNFIGVFANGLPPQVWINRRSSQDSQFNQNSNSNVYNAKHSEKNSIHSENVGGEGSFRPPFDGNQAAQESKVKLKIFQPINVAGDMDVLDLSSIGPDRPETPQLSMERMPPRAMDPQQVLRHNLDKLDMYGDYEYIDPPEYPKRIEYHKPLRHRPYYRKAAGVRALPQQRTPGLVRQPAYPRRRADFRFPGPPRPLPRPLRRQEHTYRIPYLPPPRRRFRPNHPLGPPRRQQASLQDTFPKRPPVPTSPFGLASSLLGLVSGGAKPTLGPPPSPLPEDADYFADVENDIHSPYYRPPTIFSRVVEWLEDFKPPPELLNPGLKQQHAPPRQQGGDVGAIDYTQYDTGDDDNLVFYQNQPVAAGASSGAAASSAAKPTFTFSDVFDSLRKNETEKEVIRKLFSAAASFSERSTSSPTYMFWTVPTTILAVLGAFYFISAIGIIGYQSTLGNGNTNVIPTLIALIIPAILAFIFVTSRESISGRIDIQRVMRGDMSHGMRSDFDGVDFALDGAFGAASLLGIGWLASIAL